MYYLKINTALDWETAEAKTREALQEEGFGVLTEIDMKATFKKKIDEDIRPYKILGACNPKMAFDAVGAEPDIGILLPCNVTLRELENGQIQIAAMDPEAAFQVVDNPEIQPVGKQVREMLQRALDRVAAA